MGRRFTCSDFEAFGGSNQAGNWLIALLSALLVRRGNSSLSTAVSSSLMLSWSSLREPVVASMRQATKRLSSLGAALSHGAAVARLDRQSRARARPRLRAGR
jgi:hypothetical protein